MPDRPLLSVLVCTWNRAPLLRGMLESLCAQSTGTRAFETVVVDDGSTDDTRAVVEAFADRLRIRSAFQRNSGLASARNHALFLAQAPIVLFQDDDDLAGERLVEEHLATHRAHPADEVAVLGFTNLARSIASDPLMQYVTDVGRFLFSYGDLRHGDVLGFSYLWGGRSSCKRRFLLEHGVFHPSFRFGCEDIELAFRLSRYGLRVVYDERALSTMVRAFSFDGFCARLVRQGRSNWRFSRMHPEAEVQAWTGADAALEQWPEIAGAYDDVLRSTRALDAAVRRKLSLGLPVADDLPFLHEAYWAAFHASKVKGIAEAAQERDEA